MVTISFISPDFDEEIEVGSFEFAQFTYEGLRGGNDDDEKIIGYYDAGYWFIDRDYAKEHGFRDGPWTDIVIG